MSTALREAAKAGELTAEQREAVRDLILVLADSKRLLGMRYGNWMLGAPELEAGIACASMAQDEWGHARLLYALLKDFGEDVDALEHGRTAAEYRSIEALDAEPGSWPELVAVNAFVDLALTLQFEALAESNYLPLRQRVQKVIEEERFHAAHGAAWLRRIAASGDEGHEAMKTAIAAITPIVLRWFGPDSNRANAIHDASLIDAVGSDMRSRYVERAAALLRDIGGAGAFGDLEPDFSTFDEATRRTPGTSPDERTITQIRGDRNREFLMD
ncbi:MAG: phenylacetate-CoA oxygenase subunit PaaI [Gemmatimonadetes bacterium]|nr:phenylacetate-CoA oxygenase subunit PaaI [Gemmatimonadota bacterium]